MGYTLTLPTLMKEYGAASPNIKRILKMDIEGWEWPVLTHLQSGIIETFDQIVMECHYMCGINLLRAFRQRNVFNKLCKTHALIHVHGNNVNKFVRLGEKSIPYYLELTFIRKTRSLEKKNREFPTALDFPNNANCKDIVLGKW